ncbi:nucleoside phosphorylase domain-containing protein [Aspergillus stella-maris]|uniref:nucleoside phosphorylase domain-containing protein n=1 Tax=Aspergillus stella-maris TaxID=1810926 RepID=UPI003CCDCE59
MQTIPPTRVPPRPKDKRDFRVAIICALPLEAGAVEDLFDKRYDTNYERAPGDSNAYSTGVIGLHNVVLAHMPGMGKVAAATAAACLRATFSAIELTLVVGVCGGVPLKRQEEEILLGDVVISEGLVQYDFGRQYPDNKFLRKDSSRDNLPRPRPELRSILAKLQTHPGRGGLGTQMLHHLEVLRQKSNRALYPGASEDKLFDPKYQHKHHRPEDCDDCTSTTCDDSIDRNCEEVGCNRLHLTNRKRRSIAYKPEIHLGLFASGDTVMKSGEVRDGVAARDGVIAFEMEGVGIWEAFPHVLVIKGVCDYADSHKNKRWQAYAAATAASVMKGFLDEWKAAPSNHIPQSSFGYNDTRLRTRQNQTLEKLYSCPYKDRKDRNPDRVSGTCEWFTTHGHFRQWQDSTLSKLLWVSADPGCGKSVLGRYLVDSIIPSSRSRTTCYFFFKNDFEDQQTATGALSCILHQLFFQKRELLTESIIEQFETKPTITDSFSELWDIFMRAAQDNNAGEIVCFLDALDECKDSGRSKLIRSICKLYTVDNKARIKFLLTSRPYTEIRQKFHSLEQAVPVIHLSGENEEEMQKISREIDIFVKAKVKDIGEKMNMRDDERSLLLKKLTRVPNRTYLWVYLTLDYIESSIDIDKFGIIEITSHLPETVNEAYEKILSKSREVVLTRRLLNIIVAATRPFTLDEMNVALSLKKSHSSYSDLNLRSTERFRLVLRDLCGLFVTVVDSKIYLLHQTAKEFLLNENCKGHCSQSTAGSTR